MISPKTCEWAPHFGYWKRMVFVPTIRGGAFPTTTFGRKFPKHTQNLPWNLELTLMAGDGGEISLIKDTITPLQNPKFRIIFSREKDMLKIALNRKKAGQDSIPSFYKNLKWGLPKMLQKIKD